MKAYSKTDRGRILKNMYDTWVHLGKFDLARDTMKTIQKEAKEYYSKNKK